MAKLICVWVGTNSQSAIRNCVPIEVAIEHFRQLFDYVIEQKGQVHVLRMPPKGDDKLNKRIQNLWQSVIREFKCNSDIILHDLDWPNGILSSDKIHINSRGARFVTKYLNTIRPLKLTQFCEVRTPSVQNSIPFKSLIPKRNVAHRGTATNGAVCVDSSTQYSWLDINSEAIVIEDSDDDYQEDCVFCTAPRKRSFESDNRREFTERGRFLPISSSPNKGYISKTNSKIFILDDTC